MKERTASEIRENVVTATNEIIKNLQGFKDTILEIYSQPEEKRILNLGNIKIDGDSISFQIAEQSHRNSGFTPNGSCLFIDSNGFALSCAEFPMVSRHEKLFCRGALREYDNEILTTDTETFAKILIAVKEYNEEGAK